MRKYTSFCILLLITFISCNPNLPNDSSSSENEKKSNSKEEPIKLTSLDTIHVINTINKIDTLTEKDFSKLPSDSNYLVAAYVTLATPAWGDDKHFDDSFIDLYVKINKTTGDSLIGINHIRNGSGIGAGGCIYGNIDFPNGLKSVWYNAIDKVNLSMNYIKEDFQKDLRSDVWDARFEVVFKFRDGRYLCSGYNDPAMKVEFVDRPRHWNIYTVHPVYMFNKPQLIPPFQ